MDTTSTASMKTGHKQMLMGNILGCFGNDNIRNCHIKYFENRLISEGENTQDSISSAPNYYAWLCLNTENVFWLMRDFCYKAKSFTDDSLTMQYNDLITKFCETCKNFNVYRDDELEAIYQNAVKILEVRHAIIHKGFPNLLPIVFEDRHVKNKPQEIDGKKKKFTEESTRQSIQYFSNPSNFTNIKQEFETLINISCSGPKIKINF